MRAMLLLAAGHIGFWAWGVAQSLRVGAMEWEGAVALAVWLVLVGGWLIVVAGLSRSGWLPGPSVSTHPWFWVPVPVVMLSVIGFVYLPILREAWGEAMYHLPTTAIPALNALRILAIGTVLKARRGELPRRIGYAVGIPDLIFGLWSFGIAISGGLADDRLAVLWHLTGAAILMMLLPMVYTVLRTPRSDEAAHVNGRAILDFPLVLAPAGLATLFLVVHALALYTAWTGSGVPTR